MSGIYPQLIGGALEAWRETRKVLLAKARSELGLADKDLVVRLLTPEDLGLATTDQWAFTKTSTGIGTLISSTVIGDNQFVSINGISLPASSPLNQINITRRGRLARRWNVQYCNQQDDRTEFFSDPITIDQNQSFTITADTGSSTLTSAEIVFHGLVVEKDGLKVSP